MRRIDADALAARLENECREWEGESAYQAGLCAAAAMVAEAPTVCGWISEDRPSKDSADAFVWYTDVENVEANGNDDDWISVKDRLPEDGQLVVVRHEVKGRVYSEVAHYIMNLWWLDWDSNGLELNAISWIPLPEPEEEGLNE